MTDPSPIDDLVRDLGELGKGAVPVEDAARAAYRRERVVRALERKLGDVKQSRLPARRHRWALIAAAAAAALSIGGGFALLQPDTPPPVAQARSNRAVDVRSVVGDVSIRTSNEQARPASPGEVLRGGELVRTGAGASIDIGIESGRARLAPSSELEILVPQAGERRLRLAKGGVDIDLPSKLPKGEHLVIETPDAEVLVVGTAFSVQVQNDAAGMPVTSVNVRRGAVRVSHPGTPDATLVAGQGWASPKAVSAVAAQLPAAPPNSVPRSQPRSRVAPRPADSGTLAEENRLFEVALSARNAGDHAAAAEGFRQLLARFPRSVLSEQALAGRFRALERSGRTSAAVISARRYLSAYPQGFARADAERITSAPLQNAESPQRSSSTP
jgi:hypothetical protein